MGAKLSCFSNHGGSLSQQPHQPAPVRVVAADGSLKELPASHASPSPTSSAAAPCPSSCAAPTRSTSSRALRRWHPARYSGRGRYTSCSRRRCSGGRYPAPRWPRLRCARARRSRPRSRSGGGGASAAGGTRCASCRCARRWKTARTLCSTRSLTSGLSGSSRCRRRAKRRWPPWRRGRG
ncbi:hypothetical protein ACQJBY_054095 [Aegilops geniculata]